MFFKRKGIVAWNKLNDRFGTPTPWGKYPNNAGMKEKGTLFDALGAISSDGVVMTPEGMHIELLESWLSGSVTTQQSLCEYMDDWIDAVVLGTEARSKAGDTATVRGLRYRDANGKDAVFMPDPGWDYNPGAEWSLFDPAGFKGEAIDVPAITPSSAAGVIKSLGGQLTWSDLGRSDLRSPDVPRLPDPGVLPTAEGVDAALDMMRSILVPNGTVNIVRTPIEDVIIRAELLPHIVETRADARERYANYALATLRDPFEVWLTAYEDGSYRKRYIGVFKSDKDLLVVLRENRDGSLVWDLYNLMQRDAKGLNRLREGRLLYWMGQAGREWK